MRWYKANGENNLWGAARVSEERTWQIERYCDVFSVHWAGKRALVFTGGGEGSELLVAYLCVTPDTSTPTLDHNEYEVRQRSADKRRGRSFLDTTFSILLLNCDNK
jgi:hypothetical protein